MKKLLALVLVTLIVLLLAACKGDEPVGDALANEFEKNSDKSAREIAYELSIDSVIDYETETTSIKEGTLRGFDYAEITGFDEGYMFSTVDKSIPFVGYVFDLSEDTDVNEFMENLKENANLSFNTTADADQVVVDNVGDKVVVIITPDSFDEDTQPQTDADGNMVEDNVKTYGQDFVDEF